ncbi:MAG: rhomboid family intramembrane serine protease [Flavobacteriales bacterium]|nr:rhomboid family intramembrane serine protease [Flavobacteriales bacterium]
MTLILIAATSVLSLFAFGDRRVFEALLFHPWTIRERRDWTRFISHAFVHADVPHLLVNMYVLYIFGPGVERAFMDFTDGSGRLPFLALYLGGILWSSLPGYRKHRFNPEYRAVGASGAVSAVLFAHILIRPMDGIGMLFLPGLHIPAFIFGILYMVFEWYMDKRGGGRVAHDAHLHGAFFGLLFTAILQPSLVTRLLHLQL